MRNHETTFSLILSPAVGSYELILVTVVTCFHLKERDVSLDLPAERSSKAELLLKAEKLYTGSILEAASQTDK